MSCDLSDEAHHVLIEDQTADLHIENEKAIQLGSISLVSFPPQLLRFRSRHKFVKVAAAKFHPS